MKIDITYPPQQKKKLRRKDIIFWARLPFFLAAIICPLLNLCIGGKAWSIIVLWSLYFVWTMLLSIDLVEYNRISQVIKLISNSIVLLILINALLAPGFASIVVPIVCFSGLIIAAVLFYTDYRKQLRNMTPMLLLSLVSFFAFIVLLILWRAKDNWPLIVMGALSFTFLCACCLISGIGIIAELKKYFHIK